MSILAAVWLTYETWRFHQAPAKITGSMNKNGPVDLSCRFVETNAWFRRQPVYTEIKTAVYPPASYALLWPLLGNLSWPWARTLWYALSIGGLFWLSRQLIEHSLARSRLQRTFIGMMPFASYAAGAAIGNGQTIPLLLPVLLFSVIRVARSTPDPGHRLWLESAGVLWTLVQPTITAPFFWIVLLRPNQRRHAIAIAASYLVLTLFAISFQMEHFTRKTESTSNVAFVQRWTVKASGGAAIGSARGGYGSLHDLLYLLGVERRAFFFVSLLVLLAFGLWIHRHRQVDLWLLMGITSLMARFWTYHRWYDDLLLMLPLVTLFRMTQLPQHDDRTRKIAFRLFMIVWIFSLAPGVLYTLPSLPILVYIQVTAWLATLGFLAHLAHRERQASRMPNAAT